MHGITLFAPVEDPSLPRGNPEEDAMTSTPIKLLAVALLSSISAFLGTTSNAPDAELDQIARYRQWTRVTQKLAIVPTNIDSFAAAS